MSTEPLISVVMPVYNGERYLEEAVESILNQTLEDFEFIIVNDGSTDGTAAILSRYQQIDDRILVYHHVNQGVTASRNRGCQLAKGKYIAVMDADDISLPQRLRIQVDYMETHPTIGILGTCIETIDVNGLVQKKHRLPLSPVLIGWHLIFWDCLIHSSVMMRRDVIEHLGFYRPEIPLAEDYDLWARASYITRIANIPEILLRHRVWEGCISLRQLEMLDQYGAKVSYSMVTALLGSDTCAETSNALRQMKFSRRPLASNEQIEQVYRLIKQLYQAYVQKNIFNYQELQEIDIGLSETLVTLYSSGRNVALCKSIYILIQAIRINPRLLLSKQVIVKGAASLISGIYLATYRYYSDKK